MTQQEFIEEVKAADIANAEGWFDTLLSKCDDLYARGYIQAMAYSISLSFSHDEEDFRDELLQVAEADIWGVKA